MNDIEFAAKFRQAQAAARAQNWLGAQLMCDELLAKRRNDVNLLALRAHVAKGRMEYDEAVRLFERCVSLQPRDLGLQLELARMLSWMGKYKQAISRFEGSGRKDAGPRPADTIEPPPVWREKSSVSGEGP